MTTVLVSQQRQQTQEAGGVVSCVSGVIGHPPAAAGGGSAGSGISGGTSSGGYVNRSDGVARLIVGLDRRNGARRKLKGIMSGRAGAQGTQSGPGNSRQALALNSFQRAYWGLLFQYSIPANHDPVHLASQMRLLHGLDGVSTVLLYSHLRPNSGGTAAGGGKQVQAQHVLTAACRLVSPDCVHAPETAPGLWVFSPGRGK